LTCDLPQAPLGKKIRELYCICSQTSITEYGGFKEAFLFLKVSSREQILTRLSKCVNALNEYLEFDKSNKHVKLIIPELEDFIDKFNKIGISSNMKSGEDSCVSEDDNCETEAGPLETVKYAYQLQERLKTRALNKKSLKKSPFDKLREEVVTFFKNIFQKHLVPFSTLPLHEAFYFESTKILRRHLVASPRLAMQTALSNPYHYLKLPSLLSDDGIVSPNAPDTCIAYKLHTECSNMINLYDWMTAFHTVVNSQATDTSEEEIDEMTQARFIQTASELQLLGYIKHTKRKTDHVQRLTWS